MSQQMREQVLLQLKKQGPGYVRDTTLAEILRQSLKEVQDELDNLEMRGLVQLSRAAGPAYYAVLTSKGMEYIEDSDK